MHIVWEFLVREEKLTSFMGAYGPDEDWAQLFRKGEGFLVTELLRSNDTSNRFITIDRWADTSSFELFQQNFGEEYSAMDVRLEGFTLSETKIGVFAEVWALRC